MRAILLLTFTAAIAGAQTIEVKSLFQTAPLAGVWKHQLGDDPRWADPAFDDSAWANVQMPEGAVQPGNGFSWYRVRVHLPEHPPGEPLALMIGAFGNGQAYELFWNGQRAGVVGAPDGSLWGLLLPAPKAFDVPAAARDAVIAIRLRTANMAYVYRLDPAHRTSWIGLRQPIGLSVEAWQSERQQRVLLQLAIAASLLMPAVFLLVLPLWRRGAPEYFWFGLWLLSTIVIRFLNVYPEVIHLRTSLGTCWIQVLCNAVAFPAWLGLMSTLFRSRLTWPALLATAGGGLTLFGSIVFIIMGVRLSLTTAFVMLLVVSSCPFISYYELGWRTSGLRERVGAIHLAILVYLASLFANFGPILGRSDEAAGTQLNFIRTVTLLLFTFAMAILMNQRSVRLMGERRRLSREMESAAEIQSLLLTSLPAAGSLYKVEPVYLPATEVGGDFYQILDRTDGSRVALVGDVSGKGLKAAMLVSVAIGALRREKSSSPAAILAGLNEALVGQGGFVTCCCVRYTPGGEMTMASAGHPAPYCDGREVEVAAGLPLGVAVEAEWEETRLVLPPGGQLTLVSDGVVEAENAGRELFGFDRTREISGKSAAEIAETARAWGQNDDITVVTVRRMV